MYAYSGYVWPTLGSAALIAFLAVYGWRHRKVPGALPFALGCVFAFAWSAGSLLEHAAVDLNGKIFWLKFVDAWQLPVVTAATGFVLQYSGWSRRLSRWTPVLLSVPPVLAIGFIVTQHIRPLFWDDFIPVGNTLQAILGPAGSALLDYSYVLMAINIGVLIWVAATSPARRAPATLMVVGQVGARLFFEFGVLRLGLPRGWDADPFVLVVVFGLYGIALFRFHVFDPIPAARTAAIDQMLEGMLVVDLEGRIVDANPAAERILGTDAPRLRSRPVAGMLPSAVAAIDRPDGETSSETEFTAEKDGHAHHYRMEATALRDRHGSALGHLLLLHDVTEQRRVQARALEQQRVMATLEERERLARELHDSVGQVLGYVSLQTQTVMKWLGDGDQQKAADLLGRLAQVAQNAHADVRGSILELRAGSSDEWSFLPTLNQYLGDFRVQYGVDAELLVAAGVDEELFVPHVAVQLLRVIQEALTNARRHGEATSIRVEIGLDDTELHVTVTDDGRGFDPASLQRRANGHFGLAFMRERMTQIGGTVIIESNEGAGTTVRLATPVRPKQEMQA